MGRKRRDDEIRRARRQWGSDRRSQPLPAVTQPASDRALSMGRLAVFVSMAAWLTYVVTTIVDQFIERTHTLRGTIETVTYLLIVTVLTASAVAYLVARVGAMYRIRSHHRVARAEIDSFFAESLPTMTVLVPSYREDLRVIRQTLLSAALQEYPYLRVVLLVDDPPTPTDPEHQRLLEEARALPDLINAMLAEPASRCEAALAELEERAATHDDLTADDVAWLALRYAEAERWLRQLAASLPRVDHTDDFLADHVLGRIADDLATTAGALVAASEVDGDPLPTERLLQLARRLAWIFRAEISSFERKQYVSLSHEANKAMNLNSYIGIMGQRFRIHRSGASQFLVPVTSGPADLEVPDPDYVLTLDADSVLLPEYCLRLVHHMEQPQHDRVAVAQTPYSAYPGSSTRLERLAGATTDLQHIVHQGMTYYDATFWVGANAVLRKRALDDITQVTEEDGRPIRRIIQDRTVIEDTESSVDLGIHGWRLFNYPERLSYSATPPDFGSLAIQRARWANGGLLILPKLVRHLRARRRRGERGRVGEALLRTNYLASIAWSSLALILILAYPFDDALLSPLVLLAAFPYFSAMASDLRRCGYKRIDILRIYAFNLVLLPVNVAGVGKSIGQAITGGKIAFARTPKVRNRTTAALSFVLVPYVIVVLSAYTVWRDIVHEEWGHAVFAGSNAALAMYAIAAFVGVRNSLVDIVVNLTARLYREAGPRRSGRTTTTVQPASVDWATVLYHGADAPRTGTRVVAPLPVAPPRRLPEPTGPPASLGVGQDRSGQDRSGLDRSGLDRSGLDRSAGALVHGASPTAADALVAAFSAFVHQLQDAERLEVRVEGSRLEVTAVRSVDAY
jgi:cellulose synthase (UDP-forming)